MSTPQPKWNAFENLVDHLVDIHASVEPSIDEKIGLLERLIERWRIDRHKLENSIAFEQFFSWDWQVEEGALQFIQKKPLSDPLGSGIPPIRYQRTLLVYLLLHHQKRSHRVPVLDIIRDFIESIRDRLTVVDFKRTDTGVIRCFTNTRFAANKLREYGLLNYTSHEAFKTWSLSLPGILVAAEALKATDWKIPAIQNQSLFGLDPLIRSTSDSVRDFQAIVASLTEICQPNLGVFETFEGVVRAALHLLQQYWRIISDEGLTHKERSAQSLACCQALEEIPFYDQFVEEFTDCIEIDKLLQKATTTPNHD